MILQIFFWTSVFLVFHSYVLYPFILWVLARNKQENQIVFTTDDDLPFVSVLMAVHNEEMVIVEKIRSIYYTLYPLNRFEVIIGSDNSTDGTNRICNVYGENYNDFRFFPFETRTGKPSVINRLAEEAKGDILIITDANVIFEINTIFELIKHFKNPEIGLVDSVMLHKGLNRAGISIQENAYISREVMLKQQEGNLWGTMMGPFGGCYAIRREDYPGIPDNALVDDFYVNMKILEKDKSSINSISARVTEDVSNNLKDEFKRKIRISTGNYQNLKSFFMLLFKGKRGLFFSFLSHKVIRWMGPFLIITAFISNLLLFGIPMYRFLFFFQLFLLVLALIDLILKKFGFHVVILRFITHFLTMNLALLIGFIRFAGGVKTGIWEPTRRNQSERN